ARPAAGSRRRPWPPWFPRSSLPAFQPSAVLTAHLSALRNASVDVSPWVVLTQTKPSFSSFPSVGPGCGRLPPWVPPPSFLIVDVQLYPLASSSFLAAALRSDLASGFPAATSAVARAATAILEMRFISSPCATDPNTWTTNYPRSGIVDGGPYSWKWISGRSIPKIPKRKALGALAGDPLSGTGSK